MSHICCMHKLLNVHQKGKYANIYLYYHQMIHEDYIKYNISTGEWAQAGGLLKVMNESHCNNSC